MNLESYLEVKRKRLLEPPPRRMRRLCFTCLQPTMACYCTHVRRFDPRMKFVILIHRLEVRRRIATGRLSHLCLKNSELMMGYDYSRHQRLTEIVSDPKHFPVVLFPGPRSADLSAMKPSERATVFPKDKTPVVIVIDGTWNTAKKMLRRSSNLRDLPRICFTPDRPSNFRVRKQPKPGCFSTVEAIHQTIEMLGPARGFDIERGEHHNLLHVFDTMVEQQLSYVELSRTTNRRSRHRRKSVIA